MSTLGRAIQNTTVLSVQIAHQLFYHTIYISFITTIVTKNTGSIGLPPIIKRRKPLLYNGNIYNEIKIKLNIVGLTGYREYGCSTDIYFRVLNIIPISQWISQQ